MSNLKVGDFGYVKGYPIKFVVKHIAYKSGGPAIGYYIEFISGANASDFVLFQDVISAEIAESALYQALTED